MITVQNDSRMTTEQVSRLVVDSFGCHGDILFKDEKTFTVEHSNSCYSGTYSFTGSIFAKLY
jgi:hypothetical protein